MRKSKAVDIKRWSKLLAQPPREVAKAMSSLGEGEEAERGFYPDRPASNHGA